MGAYPILYSINNERENATNIFCGTPKNVFEKHCAREKLRVPPIFFIEQVRKIQEKQNLQGFERMEFFFPVLQRGCFLKKS
jgi:hypothetical protein